MREGEVIAVRAAGTEAPDGAARVRRLAESLDRIGLTVRLLLVVRACAWIGAAVLAGLLGAGLIDLGLRLPAMVRAVLLLGGLALVASGVVWRVLPAWRLRLSRPALARRIEAIEPQHAGRIAPGVDLLAMVGDAGETGAMARAAVERAGERAAGVRVWRVVRWTGVGNGLSAFAAALIAVMAVAIVWPSMAGIGVRRVLTPWSDAKWPTRFGVADLTDTPVHPLDEALVVRVGVGPGDAGTRVRLEWKIDGIDPVTRTPMAAQPGASEGRRVYERLVDPSGLIDDDRPEAVLRYRVLTPDDRSEWTRVRLVRPPEVLTAGAMVDPPAHAADAPGLAGFRTGERELATGEATLGPVLAGSSLSVTWTFSSPVEVLDVTAWSDAALSIDRPDDRSVRATLNAEAPVRITPQVRDEHGLGLRDPVSLGVDVRADAVPGVAITQPAADEIVTADADLTIAAEAGDDVGVTSLWVEGTLMRRPADSPGAPPAPMGDPRRLAESASGGPSVARAELTGRLTPAALGAAPGDEIALRAVATDTRGQTGEARSAVRRLRVVSAEELATRLRAELAPLAGLLRRADQQQGALIDRTRRAEEEAATLVREQVALADTVDAAARSVRAVEQARSRNALEDPALESLLRDLDAVLNEAEDAARAAARAVEGGQAQEAQRAQQSARDRIGEAMTMLDRGEDAFLARRAVARVREQLERVQAETAEVGRRTAGQEADALPAEDRAALDRLAEEQRELADRAREALEELTRRAESLEKDDPAQAEALRRAAEQGRAGAVASRIQEAGQQTGENQTGQAEQSQQEAIEQLDEMLEQIDAAAGLRDTALRRKLATLIVSIQSLIDRQATELGALAAVRAGEADRGLAGGMIALRENTLGVIEDASAALAELRLIAESLREAEAAQSQAAVRLRAAPPDLDEAERLELISLSALERALAEAKKQDDQAEQREQQRKKAELRRAYRDALQEQSALRDASAPLLGRALSRRERVEARALSTSQRELADTLLAVRQETEELDDAPVFALAHEQLDLLTRAASDGLGEATPGMGVGLDQDQAVAVLASLVDVLGDTPPAGGEEQFQDGQGGEGQGQAGGSEEEDLIPPVAELRLLRDMQKAAMEMTRRVHENPTLREDAARVQKLGDLQRALAERGVALIEKMNRPPESDEQIPESTPAPDQNPGEENPDGREPSAPGAGSTGEEP